MMSSIMSYFGGRRDNRESARDAIVNLRQQLLVIEKREQHLHTKIDEEMKKARANVTSNKRLATAALRQKKAYEDQLDRLAGTRLTLETQVNAIESANLNAETMAAMKKGADALKSIHTGLKVDKVDSVMENIQDQMQITNEISDAISNPVGMGVMIDDDELEAELEALEHEELDGRLAGADHVPIHNPTSPTRVSAPAAAIADEEDEEAQLRQLQAELAM